MYPFYAPTVKRAPLKSFPKDDRANERLRENGEEYEFNAAVGAFVRRWAMVDSRICDAIAGLSDPLPEDMKLKQTIPTRFTDRLDRFRFIVEKFCRDESVVAAAQQVVFATKDWANLRDDLSHGQSELYFTEAGTLRVLITPSMGRKLQRDKAYTVSAATLTEEAGDFFVGYGGRITGIVAITVHGPHPSSPKVWMPDRPR